MHSILTKYYSNMFLKQLNSLFIFPSVHTADVKHYEVYFFFLLAHKENPVEK